MFYSVQQGSRYILSLTNQRSWFEVRRLQHRQQIKAHGKETWLEWEKVVMLFGQWNRRQNYGIYPTQATLKRMQDDNSCTKAWYAPYWFLLAIQGLTHNLPKRFPLYC